MQELILIISKCISSRKSHNKTKSFYRFHFKGYYMGQKIKSITLFQGEINDVKNQLTKGDDYLLWVQRRRINQDVLEVDLIKYKKIV